VTQPGDLVTSVDATRAHDAHRTLSESERRARRAEGPAAALCFVSSAEYRCAVEPRCCQVTCDPPPP
jgi:hypothetical protein